MKNLSYLLVLTIVMISCRQSRLPKITPDVITEFTLNDTDDPAIWVNPKNPAESIVFGTDKKTNGAIYAFDLNGKIIQDKTIRDIQRPNNVDIEYGFQLNDSTVTDILVFTEREKQQIRMFSVPDMMPLDGGGFKVFEDEELEENRLPMGVSLYKSPKDATVYAIVGRKTGPAEGYLYQYALNADSLGVSSNYVRKFGKFSGVKEIEAIAVDDENGFVYFSDEGVCIKKYHAEPSMGNEEISCFGGEYFDEDIEGIAIASYTDGHGYLIVSNQQKGEFNIFDRETNAYINAVNLSTTETDGCEAVTVPLNDTFKNGLFVAMNDEKNFYFYDMKRLGLQ
ncbi:phytase [Maribacter stanieri]|uniref:phytase n=1 Tax=Maribacter stanieri TaxID=440514 RepID=UPI0030D7F189|tara:strand:+ start:787 stop:1800 length:1014 start_codon:yes stop_codon:yes gene_type:complete